MGFLTTHVLDTSTGTPASGMDITLYTAGSDGHFQRIKSSTTNSDGRVDAPLLSETEFAVGQYRLVFACGDYFRAQGIALPGPSFLDLIPIDFGIADGQSHYHVPLLVSPYSYSTYRGS